MRYMVMFSTVVENKIRWPPQDFFGVVFDDWTSGDADYIFVFAMIPEEWPMSFDSVPLAITSMGNEKSFLAERHC